eukprot:gnl/Hemi2/4307_TR1514_c0_g1_i1.p1 gnl/Hemi2/4307_TR1514_c0_g1~~gnl/Hemi2/4307_TR1514_c0_g1_i1.p1  ORF type:complete len:366 (-),score=109.64 gnl/Hemi2/4307_TR1514_c0_g1_i1:68-1165(-)
MNFGFAASTNNNKRHPRHSNNTTNNTNYSSTTTTNNTIATTTNPTNNATAGSPCKHNNAWPQLSPHSPSPPAAVASPLLPSTATTTNTPTATVLAAPLPSTTAAAPAAAAAAAVIHHNEQQWPALGGASKQQQQQQSAPSNNKKGGKRGSGSAGRDGGGGINNNNASDVEVWVPGDLQLGCPRLSLALQQGVGVLLQSVMRAVVPFSRMRLSPDALRMKATVNAGCYSSVESEVMSFEVMRLLFGAQLHKTEREIRYTVSGPITDYTVALWGERVGVSVTRAVTFAAGLFTKRDASELLSRKLSTLAASTANVCAEDAWRGQVLHIWAQSAAVAEVVRLAYEELDPSLAKAVVLLTIPENAPWLF